MKKYEITNITHPENPKLHRIRALRDIFRHSVYKGSLGGWIEHEGNLSQSNDCWVANDAQVYGNAYIYDNAIVRNNAKVFGSARVGDNARILNNAQVYGKATIYDKVSLCDKAKVGGEAFVFENAELFQQAHVFGRAHVFERANIFGNARICGQAKVSGSAQVWADRWEINPLHIQGTSHPLTTCGHNELSIGCERHSIEHWAKNYRQIGLKHYYTSKEIAEYREYILLARRWLKLQFGK